MFTNRDGRWLRATVLLFTGALCAVSAWADTLETVERRITAATTFETTPTLGNDGTTDLVVFTMHPYVNGNYTAGDIWFTPLAEDGSPNGYSVQVTSGPTDDQLNDVSGDYIVYTAFDSITSVSGAIKLYQISTGAVTTLGTAEIILEPKIHGNRVIWREGESGGFMVKYYEVNWIGTGKVADTIAGPTPPTFDVQIGERFAVWAELDSDYDVYAYDFYSDAQFPVTTTPAHDERNPATSGDWIVWELDSTAIQGRNFATGEEITLANGAGNYNPTIDGNLVAWETDVAGNYDVWIHRLDEGDSFAVTAGPEANYLNDVFGNKVAYVNMSSGSEDIWLSTLDFIPDDPTAVAGPDQSVHIGSLVTLDGTGSFDLDGDYPLTYAWQLYNFGLAEPQVTDQLSSPSESAPSFTANLASDYRAYLRVTDSEGHQSEVDTVTISTTNSPPVADAGPDQSLDLVGTMVMLDGSQSYDDDGDPLGYTWVLTTRPAGSMAALDNLYVATPSFVADVNGDYSATLVVTDGWVDSEPDAVLVSFDNVAPVADAGGDQVVPVGDTVTLFGTGTDANDDPLTYAWAFVSRPAGSAASLEGALEPAASFVADIEGTYIVSLVVDDGIAASSPDNATILAIISDDQVIAEVDDAIDLINALPNDVFKNRNMARGLTNKLLAVIKLIEDGDYVQARNKLVNDVIGKTDGCAVAGAPDRNDWIETCEAQGQIYPVFAGILTMLDELIGP